MNDYRYDIIICTGTLAKNRECIVNLIQTHLRNNSNNNDNMFTCINVCGTCTCMRTALLVIFCTHRDN